MEPFESLVSILHGHDTELFDLIKTAHETQIANSSRILEALGKVDPSSRTAKLSIGAGDTPARPAKRARKLPKVNFTLEELQSLSGMRNLSVEQIAVKLGKDVVKSLVNDYQMAGIPLGQEPKRKERSGDIEVPPAKKAKTSNGDVSTAKTKAKAAAKPTAKKAPVSESSSESDSSSSEVSESSEDSSSGSSD